SNLVAKAIVAEMVETHASCREIISKKNLVQISDTTGLERLVQEVIDENQKSVADYQQGKDNAVMFLVGQVMKKSKGKANPKVVQEMLRRRLKNA
ncbi:MAG: Asp-tRNA(Asn)/Glu-tRNA(Gln) amidotransferase GatCAB subunit B, partial [Candidatus Omnitrophica bacterium]|nr:Asp-tRNA(Asn)/Glu-tRNA(Gln) amidotransferase GatCAB subunit B [Candidatus Omnitrophota bacterium]